jgi:hypothetical protein
VYDVAWTDMTERVQTGTVWVSLKVSGHGVYKNIFLKFEHSRGYETRCARGRKTVRDLSLYPGS